MAISLQKGQRISLEKEAGRGLNQVVMGLGWGMKQVQTRGFLGFGAGTRQEAVDLDASCLLFDANGALVDTVWFRQLQSHCGSIHHSGDDRSATNVECGPNSTGQIPSDRGEPATIGDWCLVILWDLGIWALGFSLSRHKSAHDDGNILPPEAEAVA